MKVGAINAIFKIKYFTASVNTLKRNHIFNGIIFYNDSMQVQYFSARKNF